MRRTLPTLLALLGSAAATGQSLSVYSGNGQIVLEQFLTTKPMTVVARDSRGAPLAGVPVTWTTTQGAGTIVRPTQLTDASGFSTADFLGTGVPLGLSFTQATVTASSSFGSASFFVTTALVQIPGGTTASPPLLELFSPAPENLAVKGNVNAILAAAVRVRVSVASGPQAGQLLPNIGVNMHFYNEEEPQPSPFAACRGGTVLTDSTGVAACDLVLNDRVGQVLLSAVAGEAQKSRPFVLTITPGTPCTYSISPAGQSFTAVGGTGTISLTTTNGCSWAAASNVGWVAFSGPVAGSTSANIGFFVGSNPTAVSRTATVTVGSQVFNVSQAAAGSNGSPLTITSPSPLPAGAVATTYSVALQATGGIPPYQWTSSALPVGLSLNGGVITGTPGSAGSFNFNLTLTDAAQVSVTQSFMLSVSSTPVTITNPVITNTGFPGGVVGQPYSQAVTYLTSCSSPLGRGPTIAVGAGNLPPGLSLTSPVEKNWVISGTPTAGGSSNFVLTITEVCGRTASSNFALTISGPGGPGPAGAIVPSPQAVNFAVGAGASSNPGNVVVNLTSSNGTALNYTASVVNLTGGVTWLSITSGASGTTPGGFTLLASNYQALAAGIYSAQIALQTAGNATVFLPVTLSVASGTPLSASPAALVYKTPPTQNQAFLQQLVQISASPATPFSVTFSTDSQNNWLAITPGGGVTPAVITVLANPAGLRSGTYTGRVVITPLGGVGLTIPVSLVVTTSPTLTWSMPAIDNSYVTNGPSPLPLTVNLASSTSTLQFQLTNPQAPWLTVTPRFGVTPANVTLTFDPAGLPPGIYQTVVTASQAPAGGPGAAQPADLPVTFSVRQSTPTISAILQGASFLPTSLAPGLEVQIVGSSLGPVTQADGGPDPDTGLYPTSLVGARVLFDGVPAPVLHTSDRQMTVLVPYAVAGKSSVKIVAEYRFAQSSPQSIAVAESSPGIFTGASMQGIIVNEDGSYNSPNVGASPGSVITIVGTGEGQTNPAGVDGMLMQDGALASPVLPVTAQIAGLNAEVVSATSAPGQPAGVFIIKVKVPDDVPRGAVVPVSVSVGSASSQSGVTMVIGQ